MSSPLSKRRKSSATQMKPDSSDEIPEVTDSLGLLAETNRSVEDEDQDDDDDGDEEFDDQDDESCAMTTEHSEDSNTHASETEQTKDQPIVEEKIQNFDTENDENAMDSFAKNVDETSNTDTIKAPETTTHEVANISDVSAEKDKTEISMDVDENEGDKSKTSDVLTTEVKSPNDEIKVGGSNKEKMPPSPAKEESTNKNTDEVPEVTDCLGLLAETNRSVDDEDQDDDDHGDEFNDDESCAMTTEHSGDSNTHASETEQNKDQPIVEEKIHNFDTDANDENAMDSFSKNVDETPKTDTIKAPKTIINEVANISDVGAEKDKTEISMDEDENEGDKPKTSDVLTAELKPPNDEIKVGESNTEKMPPSPAKEEPTNKNTETESLNKAVISTPTKKLEICQRNNFVSIVDLGESSSDDDVKTNADEKSITKPDLASKALEPDVKNTEEHKEEPIKDQKNEAGGAIEVFDLESDDDDKLQTKIEEPKEDPKAPPKDRTNTKCCNQMCHNTEPDTYIQAPQFVLTYYQISNNNHGRLICTACYNHVSTRMFGLLEDYKNMKPISEMDMEEHCQDLVEISDSDSESEEHDANKRGSIKISTEDLEHLEIMQLEKIINDTWAKYHIEERLNAAKDDFDKQILELENESKKIDAMFKECQVMTDKLRNDLYTTYEDRIQELPAIHLIDPNFVPTLVKLPPSVSAETSEESNDTETRRSMRTRKSTQKPTNETPTSTAADDDNSDISVVKLSAESAPADLPPPGELVRYPPRVGDFVYVMRNANSNGSSWVKARIAEQMQRGSYPGVSSYFTVFKVRIEKRGSILKFVHGKQIAYYEPAPVRLAIGTRVISLFKNSDSNQKKESYYSGIVAEMPNPVNNYRYLIFFDDGYAQYVPHSGTRAVCENSARVWEDVQAESAEFLRKYLVAYPERPMVRLHAGQMLKTEWNGKWWTSKVLTVDASLVKVYFEADDRTEWIYRGSTRLLPLFLELQAAERHRPAGRLTRGLTRTNKMTGVKNMPYVEYIRTDEQQVSKQQSETHQQQEEKKQRSVAKKSTTSMPPNVSQNLDSVTSRVVFYTPKSAVKPYKMTSHTCSDKCKRSDLLSLKELRTYNPLARPLLSGWERVIIRYKGRKLVMYRAPCGRRLRNMAELHRYLQVTDSEMGVDLFDFTPDTHCLAEFVLNRCNVSKKDLSHGKENVPVPCVNYYDNSLPEFCSYNTERTPTAGVPLNLDPEFLCGCDCTDDCKDKTKCACWKMTLEGAKTIGMEGNDLGYVYRRLPEPLPSGIFECNSRCSCKNTCLNRVAQHPLQLKLQVFKTMNRGWGIRALNDIPKGAFLCVYAGNLLTDATANLDGLNEGDEYLAELDYIEVVEQMKEGYEDDIPEADKELDKKDSDESEDELDSAAGNKHGGYNDDYDFRPATEPKQDSEFSKHLRNRQKKESPEKEKEKPVEPKKPETEDDCITISDDEDVRKPSRFTAQAAMDEEYVPKHKSVRTLFGKDEACYIMDAKVQGNIGRYLNHSCSPNVFVQNVFVDTHDPRFPWVAFFALRPIAAGTELTWNYNYDIGSVPGKLMVCYCGAPNCRGRLL